MYLNEHGLDEFTDNMRLKGINVDSLKLKYNPKVPYAMIDGTGVVGIAQEEDYYLNMKENLVATDLSWFTPFCNMTKTLVEAVIPVNSDGSFDFSNIKIELNFEIPIVAENLNGFMYPKLKSLVLFHSYAKTIRFKGRDGKIRNIIFNLEIEGNKVAKIIRENKINKHIFESWLNDLITVKQDNIGKKRFENKFQIINGKINYHTKTELVTKYFELGQGEH